MRTLKKLKLSQLSDTEMKEREMNMLKGGTFGYEKCSCGCVYEGKPGGSTEATNEKTNIGKDTTTPGYGKCDAWLVGGWTVNWYGE